MDIRIDRARKPLAWRDYKGEKNECTKGRKI